MSTTTIKDHTPTWGNPYKILSIPNTATTSQIKKSFRDLSLQLHPDQRQRQRQQQKQNLSDEELDRKLMQVLSARSFLLDEKHAAQRGRYDAQLAGETRRREQERTREASMGKRRRRMIDDLKEKEAAARGGGESGGGGTVDSEGGVDGLRKEGERMRETFKKRRADKDARYDDGVRKKRMNEEERRQIRLKWSRQKVSLSKHGILELFSNRFGKVEEVELIGRKSNAALVTFQNASSCKPCVEAYLDSDEMRASYVGQRKDEEHISPSEPAIRVDGSWKDRESVEERKLRQAAERESLLRQMETEEEDCDGGGGSSGRSFQATAQNQSSERMPHRAKNVATKSSFPPKFPPQAKDGARKLTAIERLEEMERLILKDLISPSTLRSIQITDC